MPRLHEGIMRKFDLQRPRIHFLSFGSLVTQGRITFPETGASISALASDYASAAGANPVVSSFDELWAAQLRWITVHRNDGSAR
jgi:hypothetical protein